MKKIFLLVTVLLSCMKITAREAVTYEDCDSIKIEKLLREARHMPDDISPVLYFARKFVDIPYVAHTLETEGRERLVVNTRGLDCLTLVETSSALAVCHEKGLTSFGDYCKVLRHMRYRDGVTDGYASRIHYFSEWITDNKNKGLVDDIEFASVPFTAMGKVNVWFMGRHPEKYSMLKGKTAEIKKIRNVENSINGKDFRYIPKSNISNDAIMRNTIHDGDILAIVTTMAGLDIAHVGIAVWHKDGLHLLNASSIHHKVVEEPMTLYRYMQKHPSQLGIRVVRLL